ncbi:MAG: hypothetical protein Q4A72_00720 [Bacillota bacterium]|nr:hypothetical protein [Bacillota bacterium]
MMNDRFNEMYLKIVKAKGLDLKKNLDAALFLYLEVIEAYNPSDDFVFKRACEILIGKGDFPKAKAIAQTALKKLASEEISGSAPYFRELIRSIENKEAEEKKAQKKEKAIFSKASFSIRLFEKKSSLVFFILVLLFSIVISLPDQLFKLIFLVFGVFAFVFLLEIIEDLRRRLSVKVKSALFLISLCLSLVGVYNMPASNWNDFIKVPSISEMQDSEKNDALNNAKAKDKVEHAKESEKQKENPKGKSASVTEQDMKTLKEFNKQDLQLGSYKLSIKEDKISLDLTMKPGAGVAEGKQSALGILSNLNLIKGFAEENDAELGSLYENYSITVKIRDHSKELLAKGRSNKGDKTITWKD